MGRKQSSASLTTVADVAKCGERLVPQRYPSTAEGPAGAAKSLKSGGRTWARTKDPLIKSQLLYQLSYASICHEAMPEGRGGGLQAGH